MNAQKPGEHEAKIEKVKNVFMSILRDIKGNMDSGELPEEPVTAAMEQKQELHTIDNVTALVPKQIEKVISLDEENADQFQQLMIMEKAGSEDI